MPAPSDPEDPKEKKKAKKSLTKEFANQNTQENFEIIQTNNPKFFRSAYELWNKIKLAIITPVMQEVAKALGINKEEIDIYIRHILEPTTKFVSDGLVRIDGFHHDCNNLLENLDRFRFINKEMFVNGYYKAIVEVVGKYGTKFVEKTFFPAHWPPEKVMQEIHHVMRNMQLINKDGKIVPIDGIAKYIANLKTSLITFEGCATDNTIIRIIFNIPKQAFTSAYPLVEKLLGE
jgi:hypothetical protein